MRLRLASVLLVPLIAARNSGTESLLTADIPLVPIIACWRQLRPSRAVWATWRHLETRIFFLTVFSHRRTPGQRSSSYWWRHPQALPVPKGPTTAQAPSGITSPLGSGTPPPISTASALKSLVIEVCGLATSTHSLISPIFFFTVKDRYCPPTKKPLPVSEFYRYNYKRPLTRLQRTVAKSA